MSVATQAGVGSAHLSSELDSDGPYTIHGVALGAGDVTVGQSGIKKKWPAEELEAAAETLEGKPLVKDHENNADGTVGTVTRASYKENVGVLYQAEIAEHYEELAKDIASGILDVSVRAYHDPVEDLEEDDETGALRTQNITFDNLAIVSNGAAPSNSAMIGEATALSAGSDQTGPMAVLSHGAARPEAAELREAFSDDDTGPVDEDDEAEEASEDEPVDEPDTDDTVEETQSFDLTDEELGHYHELGDVVRYDDTVGAVTGIFLDDGVHMYELRVIDVDANGDASPTDETVDVIAQSVTGVYGPVSQEIEADDNSSLEADTEDDTDVEEASDEPDDTESDDADVEDADAGSPDAEDADEESTPTQTITVATLQDDDPADDDRPASTGGIAAHTMD